MLSQRGTIKRGRGKGDRGKSSETATYSTLEKLLRKCKNTALCEEQQLNRKACKNACAEA